MPKGTLLLRATRSTKLKIGLSCDPAIPLVSIYPKEMKMGSESTLCTLKSTAELFIIAMMWKLLNCPPVDE